MPRNFQHNYRGRAIYHITMVKAEGVPAFSKIEGTPERPVVERLPLGKIIEEQLRALPMLCPSLRLWQYVIMPDHIHFAIFAHEKLPRHLGSYIGVLKVRCGQLAKELLSIHTPIFEPDFYDRILRSSHTLDTIIAYIRLNPYRLLVRRQSPDFFRRINNIKIEGQQWQAYGNMQLLDNPFKAPVVIHRADPEALLTTKRSRWQHLAANGGVLVSPFISPLEKDVRRRCDEVGGKVILLSCEPFGEREKPSGHDFELCAAGRLLTLAPMQPLAPGRATFLYLNTIAEAIALKYNNRSNPCQ